MTLWHEPLGVDFSRALVAGLRARMAHEPPEAMASVTLLLPMERMRRRVREMFATGGAAVLPRLLLVSDVSPLLPHMALPPVRSALSLRLELARLVAALLDARPEIAPQGAAFDLAGSLASLLQEMKEEGVDAAALDAIRPDGLPAHWQTNLAFLRIATGMAQNADLGAPEDVQAACLDALDAAWAAAPPATRVIVAGSTGSRGPTLRLMRMIDRLPAGDVVLPGFDTAMGAGHWAALGTGAAGAQDHPQFRHHVVMRALGRDPEGMEQWSGAAPACPARNALISLALCPPPVTDAWLDDGPALAGTVAAACAGLTLVEAPTMQEEAETVALRLRGALQEGRRAALIAPDRTLARAVAACLDRWGIEPDDSAGRPLDLSPPGRLILQVAGMRGRPVAAEALVVLLKHPLVHTNGARKDHLRRTRDLEIGWLRGRAAPPDGQGLRAWAREDGTRGADDAWTGWVCDLLLRLGDQSATADLATHAAEHRDLLRVLGAGSAIEGGDPAARPTGALWDAVAGRAALAAMDDMAASAETAADLALRSSDYARLVQSVLAAQNVVDPFKPHPDVMIWGALESRVQGADLVILGGLVDGTWPALPGADMWMSRAMRAACSLRAPERTVGLAAHDFQQAAAGREVWLTRALRTADAQTVPSRWLNRLTSLLGGIGPEGTAALAGMRARGESWRGRAAALSRPDARHAADPAPRPAPIPPPAARPRRLSVTGIETLIRDPYAIYARHVLDLKRLDPLRPPSDAAMRGIVIHDALSRLDRLAMDLRARDALLDSLRDAMADAVPGAGRRGLWLGRFGRIADDFVTAEAARREAGRIVLREGTGELAMPEIDFTLTARADRMDERGGGIVIYDYKSGTHPSKPKQDHFAKQLLLEAVMVSEGAFGDLGRRDVDAVAYLEVGARSYVAERPVTDALLQEHRTGLRDLMERYLTTAPFIARLAPESIAHAGDYDHLARFGEWDATAAATPMPVGAR